MHQQEEGLQSVVSPLHFRAATGKGIVYNYNMVTFSNNNCCTRSLIQQEEKGIELLFKNMLFYHHLQPTVSFLK